MKAPARWWLAGSLVALGAGAGVAVAATPAAVTAANQRAWLLQQLRMGQATGRFDLAGNALQRLRLLGPEDADTQLAAFELALDQQQWTAAEAALAHLRKTAAGTPQRARAETLWRVLRGDQQGELQRARMLALGGQLQPALQIYRKLFHDDPPGLPLGVEYWRLVGATAGGQALALRKLQALDQRYPDNAPLLQAWAQRLFAAGKNDQALAVLHRLGRNPGARSLAADAAWDHLSAQPATAQSVRELQTFLARYPDSAHADEARKRLAAQTARMDDPAWRAGLQAQALLDAGHDAQAETAFRAALARYPQDADLLGGLGIALMRQGQREQAVTWFQRAQQAMPEASRSTRWRDLQTSTRYWLSLAQASAALQSGDVAKAQALYGQAHRQQPDEPNAMLGLADVAAAQADVDAEQQWLQAARRTAPDNDEVLRRLIALHAQRGPQALAAFLAELPPDVRAAHKVDVKRIEVAQWRTELAAAQARGDTAAAIELGSRLHAALPGDPWIAYALANQLRTAHRDAAADTVIHAMAAQATDQPSARYAEALYLSGTQRAPVALAALAQVPKASWSADMHALDTRLRTAQVEQRAWELHAQGRERDAIALLERQAPNATFLLMLADWARQRGEPAVARRDYAKVLQQAPGNVDAELGDVAAQIDMGERAAARARMRGPLAALQPADDGQRRQLAAIWAALGDEARARGILEPMLAAATAPDAEGWRDLARLLRRTQPRQALDAYARAMADAGLLTKAQADPRDDVAMTRASRENPSDDWLARSVRSDVDTFYQTTNPTLSLMQDGARRSDGTPGVSKLQRDVRIADLRFAVAGGDAWVRVEQTHLDAGRFALDADGAYQADFGSCDLPLVLADGTRVSAPACRAGVRQSVTGNAGLAAGWATPDARWRFDLGHSPGGYAVGNWLGGVSWSGDWRLLNLGATLSRRPLSNSLLSEAGAIDPRSGLHWGGVVATGPTLSVGYDQGGRNGVWSTWTWQRLTGLHVLGNTRTRVMAGWYHKLVLRPDMRVDVGVTGMLWHYAHDLGGYALGQGGYYSPQHYASLSVPASFAWRDGQWSVLADASLSVSRASTTAISRYPLPRAVAQVLAGLPAPYAGAALDTAGLGSQAGTSHGTGYRVHAAVERRLTDHLVLGADGTLQRSQDFSPNTFRLYLRYTFHPWQGNLPLPVAPLEPYAEQR